MKITNHYNIPQEIADAVAKNQYEPVENIIRVSELINPPLIRQLKLRYWNELTADVSEYLHALTGTGIHAALENATSDDLETETLHMFKLTDKLTLRGTDDLFHRSTKTLSDYKTTSAAALTFGVKKEHIAQLNCYAHMRHDEGCEVEWLELLYYIRDWSATKAALAQLKHEDYPAIPFIVHRFLPWALKQQGDYIDERFGIHDYAAKMEYQELVQACECSNDDKWLRDEHWATKKPGGKRARLKYATRAFAEADKRPGEEVEHRVGDAIRCKYYCECRGICPHAPKDVVLY